MISESISTVNVAQKATQQLHLYMAQGCPFCHRVVASLSLTGLADAVSVSWMQNIKDQDGWLIAQDEDPLCDARRLSGVYKALEVEGDNRASVPLLIELQTRKLLSASSADITRLITTGLAGRQAVSRNLVPQNSAAHIDQLNRWLHRRINRKVYQVGFARSQSEYQQLLVELFEDLDKLEARLAHREFLLDSGLSESDLFLFATLIRFDSVYYSLFKCSYKRIADYPALSSYLRRLCAIDAINSSYDDELIREHYFCSVMHVDGEVRQLNPSRIIPLKSDDEKMQELKHGRT